MEKDLQGKNVVVTGGSRGLGRAIARRLASAGALVAVNYASDHAAAAEAVEGIQRDGGQAFLVQARLGTLDGAETLAAAIDREFGRRSSHGGVDILVNNIGRSEYEKFTQLDEEAFGRIMDINIRGTFFVTKCLYDRITDGGRIINISSIGSRLSDPHIAVYTMAKAALEALTRILAHDLGHRGITANSVAPGLTAGETTRHLLDSPVLAARLAEATALNRHGEPDEIADIVYFLASPLGRWVTAQNIDASGGYRDIDIIPRTRKLAAGSRAEAG